MIEPNAVMADEIRSLNSLARVAASRGTALTLMNRALMQCDVNVMFNYGVSWLNTTSEIVFMAYESEPIRTLAASNFSKILQLCSQVPDIARDVSTEHINVIFKKLLSCTMRELLPCLKSLRSILKYFPAPCGEFKGKLVKFLIPLMLNNDSRLQNKAIRCWCHIPIIGGGGTNHKDHVAQWERQFCEVLAALEYIIKRYVDDLYTNQVKEPVDPMHGSISLPFPAIQKIEPDQSRALLQRFTILCKCLSEMLKCRRFNAPVKISFERLLSTVQSCCSVLPKTFGFTTEGRARARHLICFHRWSLSVLKSFMQSCSSYLVQYASTVNRVLSNLLDLWKRPPPDVAGPEDCLSIRNDVYDTAILWVQTCGWKSKFFFDELHLDHILLSHWVDDVSVNEEILKSNEDVLPKSGKRKRKKVQPLAKEQKQFDHDVKAHLRTSALKVARLSVYSHGSGLSILVHKTLQETVMKILLDSIKISTHPFNKFDSSRKELYHLLLALTLSPNPSWPAPVHFALNFFQRLSSNEKNLSIRSFCVEASTVLSLVVRPRAPSLQRASVNFNDECVRSYKESSCSTFDALQSRDVPDVEQVARVDVQTSTEDLVLTADQFEPVRFSDEEDSDDIEQENCDVPVKKMVLEKATETNEVEKQKDESMEFAMSDDDFSSEIREDCARLSEQIVEKEILSSDSDHQSGDDAAASEDDYSNEKKRLKTNENPLFLEANQRDDEKEVDNRVEAKIANKISNEESLSIASMLADFVNVKADQSNGSDVSGS